ncbi:191_t:CDS:2, partial [Cetraspora pellucida]
HNSVEADPSLSVLQDELVQEMDNDNFIKNFDALMVPLLKEIEECEAALQAHKQQAIWKSKGKLAICKNSNNTSLIQLDQKPITIHTVKRENFA